MRFMPHKINHANICAAGIILVTAAIGVSVVVFFFNPATYKFYPVCLFHRTTGLNCPSCGMTRAAYALLHGKIFMALRDNALFVIGLMAFGLRGGWFCWNKWRGRTNGEFFPVTLLWLLLGVAILFAVLRNLPAFAFLSP